MEIEKSKMKKLVLVIDIVSIILILLLVFGLVYKYWDEIKMLNSDSGQEWLENKVQKTGVWGVLVLLGIQVLQVVVAFIPGEVVEIVSGVMFGAFGGLLICIIGLIIGTCIIFGLVKLLGKPFVELVVKDNDSSKFKFLEDPIRALVILFFIFLIPGLPKDILIYLIPFTKIDLKNFLFVSVLARIPSIFTSTLVGSAIVDKNYSLAVIISIIMSILAIVGLIFNKQICSYIEDKIVNKNNK